MLLCTSADVTPINVSTADVLGTEASGSVKESCICGAGLDCMWMIIFVQGGCEFM